MFLHGKNNCPESRIRIIDKILCYGMMIIGFIAIHVNNLKDSNKMEIDKRDTLSFRSLRKSHDFFKYKKISKKSN